MYATTGFCPGVTRKIRACSDRIREAFELTDEVDARFAPEPGALTTLSGTEAITAFAFGFPAAGASWAGKPLGRDRRTGGKLSRKGAR